MNLKSMEKLENNLITLTIEIDGETFAEAADKVYRRDAGKYNVPGFRRGKAPRRMIESVYGPKIFYEGVVNLTYQEAYEQALADQDIETVGQAEIEVQDIGPEGYTFVARVNAYPEIEVGEYKGLHAYKPPMSVDVCDIDAELARLQRRNARLVTVSRPIQNTDTVTLDFVGFIDDIPFEGGRANNFQLEIGSGRFIPGFDEQLIGKNSGEGCQVKVTFPEDYATPELAGREAKFKVWLHEIKEPDIPDLDDEFAKDVSRFDTLEQLRADIRENLEKYRGNKSKETFETALAEQIISASTVEIPECMINEEQALMVSNFENDLSKQGMNLEVYLRNANISHERFQADTLSQAKRQLTLQLAYEKIADLEGLELSEEEVEAGWAKVAKQFNQDVSAIKENIKEKSLRRSLLRDKAEKLVRDSAFADDQPDEKMIILNANHNGGMNT